MPRRTGAILMGNCNMWKHQWEEALQIHCMYVGFSHLWLELNLLHRVWIWDGDAIHWIALHVQTRRNLKTGRCNFKQPQVAQTSQSFSCFGESKLSHYKHCVYSGTTSVQPSVVGVLWVFVFGLGGLMRMKSLEQGLAVAPPTLCDSSCLSGTEAPARLR